MSIQRFIGLAMLNNLGIRCFNDLPVLFFNRPKAWEDSLQAQSYSYRLTMSFQPHDYKEDIKKIHRPALVVVGSMDESFYAGQFPLVFKKAKTTEVIIIPNAKHLDLVNNEYAQNDASIFLKKFNDSPLTRLK